MLRVLRFDQCITTLQLQATVPPSLSPRNQACCSIPSKQIHAADCEREWWTLADQQIHTLNDSGSMHLKSEAEGSPVSAVEHCVEHGLKKERIAHPFAHDDVHLIMQALKGLTTSHLTRLSSQSPT